MRCFLVTLTFLLCACAPAPPLAVRASGEGETCTVRINNEELSSDELDAERLRALAKAHGKRMSVDASPQTPYRCIGGVVFNLQRAGFRVVSLTVDGVPVPSESQTPPRPDPFAAFEMMDKDKSQTVSTEEWRQSVETAAGQLPTGPATDDYRCQLIRLFERLDANRDGQLSRAEWQTGKFETFSPCV